MMNITPIVKQLIIINILFFIGTLMVGDPAYQMLAMFFPENSNFHFWQPLTHMFMHGGFAHIAFNMFALYSFGSTLEHFWGEKKFLFFYISCGLGAVLLNTAVNYYFFQDGLSVLMNQGFSKEEVLAVLNGKANSELAPILNGMDFKKFIEAYFGTVVGASAIEKFKTKYSVDE